MRTSVHLYIVSVCHQQVAFRSSMHNSVGSFRGIAILIVVMLFGRSSTLWRSIISLSEPHRRPQGTNDFDNRCASIIKCRQESTLHYVACGVSLYLSSSIFPFLLTLTVLFLLPSPFRGPYPCLSTCLVHFSRYPPISLCISMSRYI